MPSVPSPARRAASRALATASLAAAPLAAVLVPRVSAAQARPVPPWERAQRPTLALRAAGLYAGAEGASTAGDGFGFDAQAAVGVGAFSLGVGYQRTSHGADGTLADVVQQGVFAEPRLALDLGYGAFVPYLAGRVARVRRSGAQTGDGVQLGGGAGLLVRLAPRLALDLSGMYASARLDGEPGAGRRTEDGVILRLGAVLSMKRDR